MRALISSVVDLWTPARAGAERAVRTAWFLTRVIVPLSAGVALLDWTGALAWIGQRLAPAMALFGLPGEAAVPIVSGFFTGVYGGVAAASSLPLTHVQLTVLAIMVLCAHNLVVESAIQSRSGTSGWRITAVRIVVGALLAAGMWQILRFGDQGPILGGHGASVVTEVPAVPGSVSPIVTAPSDPSDRAPDPADVTMSAAPETITSRRPFGPFMAQWALGAGALLVKVYLIVIALMVGMEVARHVGFFELIDRPLRPVMRLLGLSERVTFLWLTATLLGVGYGAGVILSEASTPGRFEEGDLRDLHLSIGISHALVEDTLLFVAIGAHPLWILLPRPFAAAVAVRAARRFVPPRPVVLVQKPKVAA